MSPPQSAHRVFPVAPRPAGWVSAARRKLLGIDESEVSFAKRGFAKTDPAIVDRLEAIGLSFIGGYHAALDQPDPKRLSEELARFDDVHRGFAYEGAGMALELLDRLMPGRGHRLAAFLSGPGDAHIYMVTIGAGWAWARLPLRVAKQLRHLDPVLGWLALDGFGFHQGFFHTDASVHRFLIPRRIKGKSAQQVFDTGLGRSLWFVCGADADQVAATIGRFDPERQQDLWSGVGLACCYGGGADDTQINHLGVFARQHRSALAQGAAFAAKARERAGTPADHTRHAVKQICRMPAELATKLCDTTLDEAHKIAASCGTSGPPTFAIWRSQIRTHFEAAFLSDEGRA